MTFTVTAYCRTPDKKLAVWVTSFTHFEHEGQIERLIHDVQLAAEEEFKSKPTPKNFKPAVLLRIDMPKYVEPPSTPTPFPPHHKGYTYTPSPGQGGDSRA